MKWATVDTTTHVDINFLRIYQDLSCCELFVPDRQAQRRAVIFIQNVRVGIALEQAFQHAIIAFGRSVVQRCPLPIVLMIRLKLLY